MRSHINNSQCPLIVVVYWLLFPFRSVPFRSLSSYANGSLANGAYDVPHQMFAFTSTIIKSYQNLMWPGGPSPAPLLPLDWPSSSLSLNVFVFVTGYIGVYRSSSSSFYAPASIKLSNELSAAGHYQKCGGLGGGRCQLMRYPFCMPSGTVSVLYTHQSKTCRRCLLCNQEMNYVKWMNVSSLVTAQ